MEMVDSVDDLKSSCSVRGIQMPFVKVLDAKIASALNRIIHNSHFKRRSSLEEQKAQREPFPSWKTDRLHDDPRLLPVTGANDSVENYADLLTIGLRNDDRIRFKEGRNVIIYDENPI